MEILDWTPRRDALGSEVKDRARTQEAKYCVIPGLWVCRLGTGIGLGQEADSWLPGPEGGSKGSECLVGTGFPLWGAGCSGTSRGSGCTPLGMNLMSLKCWLQMVISCGARLAQLVEHVTLDLGIVEIT